MKWHKVILRRLCIYSDVLQNRENTLFSPLRVEGTVFEYVIKFLLNAR